VRDRVTARVVGTGVTDTLVVLHTVGLTLRVLGKLVAAGLLVSVTVIERVIVPEGERDRLPEVDFVVRRDGGIVNGGDRLGLRE